MICQHIPFTNRPPPGPQFMPLRMQPRTILPRTPFATVLAGGEVDGLLPNLTRNRPLNRPGLPARGSETALATFVATAPGPPWS
jgi:hypothetical protein